MTSLNSLSIGDTIKDMSEKKTEAVPYFVHEGVMTRMERTNHRLWVLCIVLVVVLVATNLSWIIYESQFEYYTETVQEVTQDADGGGMNKFVGGDYYEQTDSQDSD